MAPCSMNWCICSAPLPVLDEEDVPGLSDLDSEMEEVFTTADLLSPAREADPFELPHETYAHLLIDEAQDVSPMQWRMLRRRGASASWTIVGDPAQSAWTDTEEANRAIEEIIGTAPVRHFRMSTNYRSPSEVYDLAAKIVDRRLPGCRPPHCGARNRSSAAALGAGGRRPGAPDNRRSHDQHRADAAGRGGGDGRRDLPAVNQRRPGNPAGAGPTGRRRPGCSRYTAGVEGP